MRWQRKSNLLFILMIGTILRFTNLEEKPLWLDEIITGLFTFGKGYQAIPKETFLSLNKITTLFEYEATSCSEIAQLLAEQSTHPPLFFCLMHQWLGIAQNWFGEASLAFQLRSLSVLFGICAIALLFYLNWTAFSQRAGLVGASFMAVSPFTVYLAQEARHYTFLLILITVALFAFVKLIPSQKQSLGYWLLWGTANSLGLYTHYFFGLAFLAQILSLFFLFLFQNRRQLTLLLSVVIGVSFSYLPWLPTFITHLSSSETEWLPPADWLSPLYLLLGGLIMVITLPVEQQPLLIQIISGCFMLGFGGWVIYQTRFGYQQLLQDSATRKVTLGLSLYLGWLLIQFLLIIYLLDKNFAIAPRYNYVYYPAICALLAASLTQSKKWQRFNSTLIVFAMGIISSLFVVFNFVFLKPYLPEITAQRLNQCSEPVAVIMAYKNNSDLAIGLSYGLALNEIQNHSSNSELIFLNRSNGYSKLWQKMKELDMEASNVWLLAPGLQQKDFPDKLSFHNNQICQADKAQFYRIGNPYQRYSCQHEN